jgi:hypothetical protein
VEEIALSPITPERLQDDAILVVLNPLGRDLEFQIVGQSDHGSYNPLLLGIPVEPHHKGTIELEPVHAELDQIV